MYEVSIVGVDLAKQVFQIHGTTSDGRAVFRKKLSRPQFAKFMGALPPCIVAMEACGTAHYWGRELARLGHDIRLIPPVYVKPFPPVYVKPFVKRQKNDAADAEAIAEAAQRPNMHADHPRHGPNFACLFTRDQWILILKPEVNVPKIKNTPYLLRLNGGKPIFPV